jgi:hypothetical protein
MLLYYFVLYETTILKFVLPGKVLVGTWIHPKLVYGFFNSLTGVRAKVDNVTKASGGATVKERQI